MSTSDRHKETYREEAYELLAELEDALLELEERPGEQELVGRVFRAMHTIKGSGSMFGFDEIASFTHEVETVFDLVRSGEVQVSKELIDLALASRDYIRDLLDASVSGEFVDDLRGENIVAALRMLAPKAEGHKVAEETAEEPVMEQEAAPEDRTYRIVFKPSNDIFLKGTNPVYIIEDLCRLGECLAVAQTRDIPTLDKLDPEQCYTYWDILLTTSRPVDEIRDAFIFVEAESEVRVEIIDEGREGYEEADYKMLGEILVERGDIRKDDLVGLLRSRKMLGQALVDSGLVEETQIESALAEQRHIREVRRMRLAREDASTIRVSSNKLDTLVDLVGELVTVRARLAQLSSERLDPELIGISEAVERLTAELHDNTMSIRMVPIGTTFSKFRRLVRDLSADLGREVRMVTKGAETELDKTVIERLNDPLVHIIRNCIDHGIEPPASRESVGKPREGTVRLSAMHSGPDVLIEIRDDGKGLDPEAIHSRAVDRGLVSPEEVLSEKDMQNLIFLPGFSTSSQVTGVSGRGVGMDVVKRGIEALRGTVEVDSRKGQGTAITLRLPLTLAIIEGLLVKIGGSFFVIPLSTVEECVELAEEDIVRSHGRHIVNVRGEIVPYIRLREKFLIDGDKPDMEQIVIIEGERGRVGFVVDSVIGEHQTVIKSLGKFYRGVQGISGATILGDGTVALILDVLKLVELVEENENIRAHEARHGA